MNKAIDALLYSRKLTRCWMYANIFSCCTFSTRHMRFAYLHWSWWQQTSLASKCFYNVSAETTNFFCATTTRSKCVVHFRRSKRKQTLTAKKMCFFFTKPAWHKKSFNLLSVILSLSAEIICRCTGIDVSLSFIAWHGFTCMACVRPCNSNCVFFHVDE